MKTIFIGPFGGGKTPTNGASIKNYHILSRLRPLLGKQLKVIDTEFWKKSPKVLFNLMATVLTNPKAKYILSLNNASAIKMIRIIKALAPNADILYWVIGGSIAKWTLEEKVKKENLQGLKGIIVEGESMKNDLDSVGLKNIFVMPNFKHIHKLTNLTHQSNDKVKFVFLSRIIPEKGVLTILESISKLNNNLVKEKFEVDFFGPIEDSFKDEFLTSVSKFPNVSYKGFLDLRDLNNYNVLANYDAMLFPTFWPGEGCPGIVIDAYMVGLPIIATDWSLNRDYVSEGKTGFIVPPKDPEALGDAMEKFIGDPNLKVSMREEILHNLERFDIDYVLSNANLSKYHIV